MKTIPEYQIFDSSNFLVLSTGEGEELCYEVVEKNLDNDGPARSSFLTGAHAKCLWQQSMAWRLKTPSADEVDEYLQQLVAYAISVPLHIN